MKTSGERRGAFGSGPNSGVTRAARLLIVLVSAAAAIASAQIPEPADAPRPRPPEESARAYRLPEGFRLEVIASEPLIASPSGLCWDERGRMFVSELHGYNLEGQLDIEELNKMGQLDTEVRRAQADDKFKEAAKSGTYGVVKLLSDRDGDGRMDRAEIWADGLPPAYGLVPARGGVIVACAPDIIHLADLDGDGHAEVRETLFTGFGTGVLERGVNAPQWGVDGWIYFGRGHSGGVITGPALTSAVEAPGSDFRIRPDGSVIEAVTGGTHTFGFAMTETGDRFVSATTSPGVYVAPLPWPYLRRNPNSAATSLELATGDRRAWPRAAPHPWRKRRSEDPGFFKFSRDRYGASDSDASGWFTSACGPFIYLDGVLPGLCGQYFVCEPSGNILHRARIEREGTALALRRIPGEEQSEFAASDDSWSHPVFLTHGPDGCLWIVDYYREIIEDYSAIPRYLQQQYGLYAGHDRGRIYRLTHRDAAPAPAADMSSLDAAALALETASSLLWRRRTAQRLLLERGQREAVPLIRELLRRDGLEPSAVISALRTLDGLGELRVDDVERFLAHDADAVRVQAWQLADRWFGRESGGKLLKAALASAENEREPRVLIQCALSLGESQDPRAFVQLARLAREHLSLRWMDTALLSSLYEREGDMLAVLLPEPGGARELLAPLARSLAASRDEGEFARALALTRMAVPDLQALLLGALGEGRKDAVPQPLGRAEGDALAAFAASESEVVRAAARTLADTFSGSATPLPEASGVVPAEVEVSEETIAAYVASLDRPRDARRGREVYREACALCHRLGEEGHDLGPDLLGELGIAEETLVRHLLLPNEEIRPGFETALIETESGATMAGVLSEDGATSLTLRLPGGAEQVVLRKDVVAVRRLPGSLMPSFAGVISPEDAANLLGWLRLQLESR
ncbi:MAG TPA: PVC-type heme-binding CxxCH protein [Verrucomicrobiales bacterium]|nr:PVC-type heme-binding CxxCH protein [Verrucomicrobiales bacterium]